MRGRAHCCDLWVRLGLGLGFSLGTKTLNFVFIIRMFKDESVLVLRSELELGSGSS